MYPRTMNPESKSQENRDRRHPRSLKIGGSKVALILSLAFILAGGAVLAEPFTLGTSFAYSGYLKHKAAPAEGPFDFEVELYDARSGGKLLGSKSLFGIAVESGSFRLGLDFGEPAEGHYLEIKVRPAEGGIFATLNPRQAISGGTTCAVDGDLTVNGVLEFQCPRNSIGERLTRVGGWCMDPLINSPDNALDAIRACTARNMMLCPIEAIMACDAGNIGLGAAGQTCGNVTDSSPNDFFVLTSSVQNNSDDTFDNVLIYNGRNNASGLITLVIGETSPYFCCLPISSF